MSWPCEDVAAHEFVARGEERGAKYEKRGRVEDDAARGQPDSPCGEFSRKRALKTFEIELLATVFQKTSLLCENGVLFSK